MINNFAGALPLYPVLMALVRIPVCAENSGLALTRESTGFPWRIDYALRVFTPAELSLKKFWTVPIILFLCPTGVRSPEFGVVEFLFQMSGMFLCPAGVRSDGMLPA
ncbi:hypothetical protein ACWDYK_12070 [Streptomyces anthocyanicus]|uniref:hypothetical protein n=1 Tax=Streptomyces anthocyanicus TaxID=68174 RepID=UPI002F906A7C|nr:hypothetical protein OHA15_41560 [Streptomyces anthocyanicus]